MYVYIFIYYVCVCMRACVRVCLRVRVRVRVCVFLSPRHSALPRVEDWEYTSIDSRPGVVLELGGLA